VIILLPETVMSTSRLNQIFNAFLGTMLSHVTGKRKLRQNHYLMRSAAQSFFYIQNVK